MTQITGKEIRSLAEVIYFSEHPGDIPSEALKVKAMRVAVKLHRILRQDDEADALLKLAREREWILASARQRMKRGLS